ncbi:hypothetical protein [Candidatus Magnetaquicoccus inordinatus]|uniref:hypothetical protein n=1 Tax=Candidatus Magnetaquicoccus inordinatus TaxID=2496818 RepID=UPI00102C99AC|nr:hypothetical protein [Candidatus Magnetaquicoccus inordinatus]
MKISSIRPVHRVLMALVALFAIAVMARLQLQGYLPLLAGMAVSIAMIGVLLRLSFSAYNRPQRPLSKNHAPAAAVAKVASAARVEHMHFHTPTQSVADMKAVATSA